MSNQSDRQASVRAITGTAYPYEGDFHALFDLAYIPAGDFNGRFLQWINQKLFTTYTDLPSAQAALAAANGASDFNSLGTFDTATYLRTIFPSCLCDIDATIEDSYPGTGTDLTSLAGIAAYDFTITGNPAFTGTAGSPSAYFLMDGTGDRFGIAAGNTDFLNNMHKTTGGEDFTVFCAYTFIQNDSTQMVWTTQTSSTAIGTTGQVGSNEALQLVQGDGSTANASGTTAGTMVNATDYLIGLSHSHVDNLTRLWVNSLTPTENSHTFNAETDPASGAFTFMARPGGGSIVPNTTRFRGGYIFPFFADEDDVTKIYAHLSARHNINYLA